MIRVVLDSNIIISAIAFRGNPRKILQQALDGKFKLCLSLPILEEVGEVLIRKKFSFPSEFIEVTLAELKKISLFVKPHNQINIITRDPDDNRILECASEAKAQYIVTGDLDLLDLGEYEKISILSAREFLEINIE